MWQTCSFQQCESLGHNPARGLLPSKQVGIGRWQWEVAQITGVLAPLLPAAAGALHGLLDAGVESGVWAQQGWG